MDPDPVGSFAPQIAILIVLIAINAFFAMAEMATISANKARIRSLAEGGVKNAALLVELMERPNRFLSVIQVCITFAGFLQSAIAATGIAEALSARLEATGIPYAIQIGVVAVTVVLAFINLVFGELIPKRLALQHSERVALFTARPVRAAAVFTFPFVWLLSRTVGLILRLFGINEDKIEDIYSEEEILSILEVGQETGHIDETGKEMIDNIFQFDDKLAYEIMTPRTDVYMQDIGDPLAEYLDEMIKTRFSRIPYFDKDNDDIVGVLYMKDFMIQAKKVGWTRVSVRKLLQKPFFVPESKNIADLFEEMKESRTHMAFLVDEYGGLSGIVTTEDLIEEVMGDISDEYDDSEPKLEKISASAWILDGNYYLDDLNDELGLKMESDDFETVGGLLIDRLGEIADEGDDEKQIVYIDRCKFTVEAWKDRRIETVRLELLENAGGGEGGPSGGTARPAL
ncbi:MAG: hemolysin family protein [Clostridiales Family XIII bacterium]|jgi:putative hemolysin|nr:hemolysin family protein [Clostridiales Family XIII bacterium]